MADEQKKSFLDRFFWPLAVLALAVVVAVIVVGFRLTTKSSENLESELNDRYVQKISIEYNGSSGNSTKVIVIDGSPRYDCTEKDARLTCSDDPKPTLETSAR